MNMLYRIITTLIVCTGIYSFYQKQPSFLTQKHIKKFNKKIVESKKFIIDALGYDPEITVYPGHKDQLVVYFHGFGDSQKSVDFFKRNSNILPETVIGFNFKDANFGTFIPEKVRRNINCCQGDDIASAAMVLKLLDESGLEAFHLFGHSRGGGTLITTIARLHRYKRYRKFFAKLGISQEQAKRIITKIKAGTVILNCPLIDVYAHIKHKLKPLGLEWATSLIHFGMACATKYNHNGVSPLKAGAKIKKLNLPILVHFQNNDIVLGNELDAQFYQAIIGPNTYLVLGNDGGHVHRGETLSTVIESFRNGMLTEYQPTYNTVQHYVETFYKNCVATFIPESFVAWQQKLKSYDMQPLIEKLGYDPKIHLYHADNAVTDTTNTTVYVHGYGDNHAFTVPFFQYNSYLLPGTVVSFDFKDVIEGAFMPNIKKSNVGQGADIASLASVLKVLDDCGLKVINLFGYSRGGATTVTTLARLCDYAKHKEFFSNLGISQEQAARIIAKIKAGTIILNCPLVDSRSVAKYWFGWLGDTVLHKIIPHISEHRADSDQALYAARVIQSMNFPILVHFEKHDTILGNSLVDAEFYTNLKGPHTYLTLANEGGHLHTGQTLGKAVQAFRKKYNTAYYPNDVLIKEGEVLLKKSPSAPNNIKEFVNNFYYAQ